MQPEARSAYGVACSIEPDKGIRLTGTNTRGDGPDYRVDFYPANDVYKPLPAGTYTLSCHDQPAGSLVFVSMRSTSVKYWYETLTPDVASRTFTVEGDDWTYATVVGVNGGVTVDHTLHPMLESGGTAHNWQPPANNN
ncbi:hypothetical protein DSM100688_0377 [Bifidobacterium ramosum]|uniref:Uncharacterized protein n=1 Tax=Bifidobacterium ramosum TaxID=1798158 RepID=A0A6L4X531_9BIFI|nr:hypothetical protein [Bifidobacterium ramosum]KAB8289297.1 hypothetical protein DSM100688_0377 [Bifidobacterium ramosum]NEG71002.1 hypothetical protein [Bifidobacterium ramosum]